MSLIVSKIFFKNDFFNNYVFTSALKNYISSVAYLFSLSILCKIIKVIQSAVLVTQGKAVRIDSDQIRFIS